MGVQDIIAIVIAVAAGGYVIRALYRSLGGNGGCNCDAAKPSADRSSSRSGLKRTPLVPLDHVKTPDNRPEAEEDA